jgi:hypothetical protein
VIQRDNTRSARSATQVAWVLWTLAVVLPNTGCSEPSLRRFPLRPVLWQDDDRRHLNNVPTPWHRGRWAAVLAAQVTDPLERLLAARLPTPARNVNAQGEVPDSSWFVNRNHRRPRSPAELRRGAARTTGPSLLSPWIVRWAARTPAGLRVAITDEQLQRFVLSFDAPGHRRLATTAELVATLVLHALGFHVPERHLVLVERSQLRVTAASRLRRPDTRSRAGDSPLRPPDAKRLLDRLDRLTDGSLWSVATRDDGSQDLGPFRFTGRRTDDANDYVDHQRRRELRGLWPVAALLNLTRISSQVGRDHLRATRPRYVEHRLVQLRSALGSTRRGEPKPLDEGFRSALSFRRMLRQAITFSAISERWRKLHHQRRRQLKRWPSLGWLPAEGFTARSFRPHLGNAAFSQADDRDRFWGARLVASLTTPQLRAIVAEAMLPKAEAKRLLSALTIRRRAVLRHTLAARAPFDGYRVLVAARRLCFVDLWRREGFDAERLVTYQVRLRSDRGLVATTTGQHRSRCSLVCVALPRPTTLVKDDGYRVLEIRRADVSQSWARIHLRPGPTSWRIAGIER